MPTPTTKPDLPLELAAMYQPMAAGIRWSAHDSGLRVGDTVVVLGRGQRGSAGVVAGQDQFTGAIETGRMIPHASTGNLERMTLELGGKSPNVTDSGLAAFA